MKFLTALLLLVLVLNPNFWLFSQKFSFVQFANSIGLPQSQVSGIDQDEEGYLWVSTLGGLAKFNGRKFIDPELKNLYSSKVSSLLVHQSDIYFGHPGGISVLSKGKLTRWSLEQRDQANIINQFEFFNGKMFCAVDGGGLYCLNDRKLSFSLLPNEEANIVRALKVYEGVLYLATRDGLYSTIEGKKFQKIKFFEGKILTGLCVLNDQLCVSVVDEGVYAYSISKGTKLLGLKRDGFSYDGIFADASLRLWTYGQEGLMMMDKRGKVFNFSKENGLPSVAINRLFEDVYGNLWLATDGKGIYRFCGIQNVGYTKENGLLSDLILSVSKMSDGNYLFGTYDQGLGIHKFDGTLVKSFPDLGTIWNIQAAENGHYIASSEGLYFLQGNNLHLIKQGSFRAVDLLLNGELICASEEEVYFVKNKQLILKIPSEQIEELGQIRKFEYFDGRYLCASSKGLFEFDFKNKKTKRVLKFSTGIYSMELDFMNQLWIGTEDGIVLYNGIQFKKLSIDLNFINFIHSVNQTIWVGTNSGVYIFEYEQNVVKLVDYKGLEDGIFNLETNLNSCYFDGEHVWFGTAEAMVRMENKNLYYTPESRVQRLNIRSIRINNEEKWKDYGTFDKESPWPRKLKLPYNKNSLSIFLDPISLSESDGVRISYILEGYDQNFTVAGNAEVISYNNLPSGEYRLIIQAISKTGVISDEYILEIEISTPFWQRWYVIFALITMMFFGVRYVVRTRVKREREKNYKTNLENQNRLIALEAQSLNASLNRHFIFNSLNSIQYFINQQDRRSANRFLTAFAKLMRKNLDSANSSDFMLPLSVELERLELYLSLEKMRFKDRFDFEINTNDLDIESLLVPTMLLQPFVENAIIHGVLPNESVFGHISINLKVISGQMEIAIDDNGVGYEHSMIQKKGMQGDHKSQGMEITTKRIELIRQMMNKSYELIGPFQLVNNGKINGTRVLIKMPYENLENNLHN